MQRAPQSLLVASVIGVVVSAAVFFWGGMVEMTTDCVVRAVPGAILRTGSTRSQYRGMPAPRVRDESKGGAARPANQQSIAGADQKWQSKSKNTHVDASHFLGRDRTGASPQWPLYTSLSHQFGEPR